MKKNFLQKKMYKLHDLFVFKKYIQSLLTVGPKKNWKYLIFIPFSYVLETY